MNTQQPQPPNNTAPNNTAPNNTADDTLRAARDNAPEYSVEDYSAPSGESAASFAGEREQFAAEKAELQERLLRSRAEFDNARRRWDRERLDFFQFASMDLVGSLLPVLDDFERALAVETTDREYARGVELIYQRMSEILKKAGLEPIETAGQTFDPNVHQAVERVQTEEAEDQAILGEFQRGYNFKGKLLRPAMVRVAVQP